MKKIFLALCLLYLTLCQEKCIDAQRTSPSKSSDCVGKTPSSDSTVCCYVKYKVSIVTFSYCTELPKGLDTDQIKAEFKKLYGQAIEIDDFSCKGSYLKMGLLLLAAFLL